MNIKNLLGNTATSSVTTATVKNVAQVDKPIQADNTHDRDANGQQSYQKEKPKERMSREQFEKALALLREKSFIKDMQWVVLAVYENDVKYALVQDSTGQLIRKIAEYDLWDIFEEPAQAGTKGQLLKRTA
ncbi:hypothetical protein [Pseudobdellovibrio exovorus]|uniref:Flagellar protein FlaG n=1 Tax=Pseudobdellovibrio exovorus JSS TaxID=1184267 RepID=M4VSW4_9BACT|nr:hypothetical protein [Pseudobdellovibrio exovorus]AGH96299.1 hypothetical protein A11Q_2083 [Pseudobdellovibrio exovorus JSS]